MTSKGSGDRGRDFTNAQSKFHFTNYDVGFSWEWMNPFKSHHCNSNAPLTNPDNGKS